MDKLHNLHRELLYVLQAFQKICEEEKLAYFPIDGTLLGLVRHKGFIPWDDDVDIGMPRPDFEKFVAAISEHLDEGMSFRYFKHMDKTAKNIQYGVRLYSSHAQIKTNFYGKEEVEDINIDIFPIDGMPKNKILYQLHKFRLLSIKAITKFSQIDQIRVFMKRPPMEQMLIRFGQFIRLDRVLNTRNWYERMDRALKKYAYESSDVVGVFWSDYRFHEMVPKSCYEPCFYSPFEDIQLPCPARAEVILEQLYGDWKNPPKDGPKQKHPIEIL